MRKNREAAAAKAANGGADAPKKWGTPGVTPTPTVTTPSNNTSSCSSSGSGSDNDR
jgi:hypothetical protein